ncbi:tyrosine-type recombinase/integrase [Sunxiuqinia elliptica]|uniref:Site-specific recombinase XerD n=1 Tax=Sunxiuqinia elliptica TaxID=655355 RepID=A0A1I2F248_9BACT|nr:site-specific integrase [Sunxiuqinia elliptica]SFE98736.1 Site-specific recombinase XerD [Sunxiuqinia elliptica]
MPKLNFFLKEPKSKEKTLVYLFFSYNNKRLKYSTGEKILVKFWNSKDQRAKETKKFPEYPEFNQRLTNIVTTTNNAYRKILNDGKEPSNKLLKDELDAKLRFINKEEKPTLLSFIDRFIEENKPLKSDGTIKTYNQTKRFLNQYSDEKKQIDFQDINLEFYNSFLAFMINKGYSQNSIGKYIQVLKTFLNAATDRGINKNFEYRNSKFKRISEQSESIYLTTDELDNIYNLNLERDKQLDKVRDLFIIGCYSGLRFSDFSQLKPENFIDENKIRIRTEKTDEIVIIPQHRYVRSIFKKYKNQVPPALSNQKMNVYIKHIGKIAKITKPIETSITKGGKVVRETKPKYQLITTHTARRSFATNLYLADVPTITIMKITGHKTEQSFLKYIKISQEENANKLLNHPFFK